MGLFSTAAKLSRIANKIDTPVSTRLFTRPEKLNNIEVENKQVSNTEFDTRIEGLDEATTATDWQKKTKKFVSESRDVNPTVRTPELENSTMDLIAGKITREQHLNNVDEYKPVNPWDALPREPSSKATVFSLKPNQREDGFFVLSTEDAKSLGVTKSLLAIGQRFLGRLDIPAYKDYDTWIVAGKSPKGEKGTVYAKAIHYGSEDGKPVVFRASQGKSEKIGKGKADPDYTPETHEKTGYATVDGIVQDLDVRAIRAKAAKYLNDPEWTQVGFDPRRQGGFYVRAGDSKHVPIREASEVIQIGPLVLAKNAKLDFEHVGYAEGGAVSVPKEKVGTKTSKSTQIGRDVYETSDGEMVSEKSTTFQYKGKWINVPTIHNGYQYDDDTLRMLLEEGIIEPTSIHEDEPSASKAARERSDNLKFNKGGTPMQRQMELFGDGGLKDEGGMIDSESGNEVPIGGTRKGVRDDIPANISEGEFIFPEDVTRYIGLDKLMQLRQEAKMGLKKMEAMGQMGNSDEATMEDDLPFGMADIIVVGDSDEPMEFADGGFVPVKNYEPGGLTTGTTGSTRINQGVDNSIVVDDNVANTGTQSATRSLVGETTTIPRTTVKFKDFMGEALIELRQFINEAGNIITLPFRGGVILPSYIIPEGYTAVVTEETVDTGDEDANAIIEDANNAVKEVELKEGKDFIKPPAKPAVDWNTLSTSELVEETNKITGVNSTIANGLMLFLGPVGAVGYALMRNEKKNKAAIIAARIAKGGLSTAEVESLTAAMELLKPTKDLSLLDKTLDFVGGLLGKAGEEISAVKKTSINIEQNVANQVEKDLTGDLGPVQSVTTNNNPNLVVPESYTPTSSGLQAQLAMNDQTDMRERQSPVDMGITKLDDALFRRVKTPETYAGMRDGLAQDFLDRFADSDERRNEEADNAARRSLNNQVKAGDFDGTILAPGEGKLSTPVSAPVAAQTETVFPTPVQEDFSAGVPETRFTAPVAPPLEPLENYVAPYSKKLMELKKVSEFGPRLAEKTSSLIAGDKLAEYQAKQLGYSTEQPVRPNIDVVPPSPVTGKDLRPAGDTRDYQGGAYGYGQTGVATAPVTAPVATATLNATETGRGVPYYPNAPTIPKPVATAPVANQMEQTGIDSTVVGGYDEAGMNALTPSPVKTPVVIPAPTSIQPTSTTSTAPAAPVEKGSNSLYQSFLNLVTPFDNKEYQDGKLIETAASKSDSGTSSSRRTAKVKSGDTLSKIAKDNNTTVAALKAANNIADVNKIQAGASLVIPGSSSSQSVDTESSASSAIDKWQNATEVVQSLGSDPDPADWHAAIQAQSQASVEATAAIKARTAARNEAEENNKYKGGLLSKPKKKTKATTKKRGLAARK